MNTLIIGGGKGCKALISLAKSTFLKELTLNVVGVMDRDEDAPGLEYARSIGLMTFTDMQQALSIKELEVVVELTGSDKALAELYKIIPEGVKVIDHTYAHVFWDLINVQEELKSYLREKEDLERRLQEKRYYLQTVFNTLGELIIVIDRNKRVQRVNKRFLDYVGFEEYDEVKGKKCSELLKGTPLACDEKQVECDLESVFKTGKPHTFVQRTNPPNESYWEITRTPLVNESGEIDSVIGTWHRITDKVLLKREVEVATKRFQSFIDSAQDMISIKDLDGYYMLANPTTAEKFHLRTIDFIGKTARDLLPPETAKIVDLHDKEIIRTNESKSYDEILIIDGREHHYKTTRFPLRDYDGSTIGVCSIARDVTHEQELQNQLVQSTKLAALGNLAAGVAHEINNPLTGILAYAEDLLEEVEEGTDFHDDLQVIIRETKRCGYIVRNLLDFSRQDKLHLDDVEPSKIIEQTIPLVERLPQFRDVQIEKNLNTIIPKIRCDVKQIQQVLLNFMTNAADAMKGRGKITVSTGYNYRRDKCYMIVEDNGPGIPENLIDKIFEPFFSTKGTNGLGLAVSWGIIERHGGTVEVDTAETGGAIFKIILPAVN